MNFSILVLATNSQLPYNLPPHQPTCIDQIVNYLKLKHLKLEYLCRAQMLFTFQFQEMQKVITKKTFWQHLPTILVALKMVKLFLTNWIFRQIMNGKLLEYLFESLTIPKHSFSDSQNQNKCFHFLNISRYDEHFPLFRRRNNLSREVLLQLNSS